MALSTPYAYALPMKSLNHVDLCRSGTMRAFLLLALVGVVACGDSTGPASDDPLPELLRGEGVLRFTLSDNCPTLTLTFAVDAHLHGPHTLTPGSSSVDFAWPARTYVTSARASNGRTFPDESTTVPVAQRVTRNLRC